MKVALSSTGPTLTAEIDPRFGRCEYFLIVSTEDLSYESFPNDNAALSSGAGIQAASFVASKNVAAVLTGNCGPKASQALSAAGIEIYTGFNGPATRVIEQFKEQTATTRNLSSSPGPSADQPAVYPGGGSGGGGGGCRLGGGTGRGRGGGGGGGRRCFTGNSPAGPQNGGVTPPAAGAADSANPEINDLKAQLRQLKQQLQTIDEKISNIG